MEIDDALDGVGRLTTPDELKQRGVVRLRSVSRAAVTEMVREAVERAIRELQTEPSAARAVREDANAEVQERLRAIQRPHHAEPRSELERNVTSFVRERFRRLAADEAQVADAQDEIVEEVGIALRTAREQAALGVQRKNDEEIAKLTRRIEKLLHENEVAQAELSDLRGQPRGLASGGRRPYRDDDPIPDRKALVLDQLFAANQETTDADEAGDA